MEPRVGVHLSWSELSPLHLHIPSQVGTPACLGALTHGSSTQAPLPIDVAHDKAVGLRSKTLYRHLQKQHKLLILCFCLWNKVIGIKFGNLMEFESLLGCGSLVNWVQHIIN